MTSRPVTLMLFTRAPVPGQTKTRLIPALGEEGAAQLHRRLLESTLHTLSQCKADTIELWCTPDSTHPAFQHYAANYPLTLKTQQGTDLGQRLAHAFELAITGRHYAIAIGSDCPELAAGDIERTIALLDAGNDAVIGPAADGGYYLLGLRRFETTLFQDIAWGTQTVLRQTLNRLQQAGFRFDMLDTKHDLDRPADLVHFPELYSTTDVVP